MKLAAIDIGTNSTRLLIADYKEGKIVPLYSTLEMTRIGEGIGKKPFIKPVALKRTLDCLFRYKIKCQEYGVAKIRIAATSAVRDAENKDFVKMEVLKKLGLKMEILTGTEEARLSYLGAVSDFENKDNNIVLDIGGGSTELVFSTFKGVKYNSVNIGAVRLAENPDLMKKVKKYLLGLVEKNLEDSKLIGVGGTVTTLAAIKLKLEKYDPVLIHGQKLTFLEVAELEKILFELSIEERKKLKGLQPQRADIIPYGTYILREIMEYTGYDSITVSERDILFGLIITALDGKN